MYLSEIQISNYASFKQAGSVQFKPGINIIIGKNNTGKTALLKALGQKLGANPYISQNTTTPSGQSKAILAYSFDKALLQQFVRNAGHITIPFSREHLAYATNTFNNVIRPWFQSAGIFQIKYELRGGARSILTSIPSQSFWPHKYDFNQFGYYRYKMVGNDYIESNSNHGLAPQSAIDEHFLTTFVTTSTYLFSAERPNIGQCPTGISPMLKPDASNLPSVLSILQGNHSKYERYVELIRYVLPSIQWLSVKPTGKHQSEIRIWLAPRDSEKEDISIPLQQCGTGVGHVLAMIYVAMFYESESKIIIIDEPQSYLHPSAIRELIEVFKIFSNHQYIIATHSPIIIAAAKPSAIIKVTHDGNEAHLVQINTIKTTGMHDIFQEIGFRLSDVFGADSILWVEGETEEECFPLILRRIAGYPMHGLLIMAVENTGDFGQKKVNRIQTVFSIYRNLSEQNTLFPPAVGFIFDTEGLNPNQIEDKKKEAPAPLDFLPRRLYENYLLHPEAIAHVLNQSMLETTVTTEQIIQWIEDKKKTRKYLPQKVQIEEWVEKVHGGDLLKGLFQELSENTVEYSKTTHSVELTEWLLDDYRNEKNDLREVSEFLEKFLRTNKVS